MIEREMDRILDQIMADGRVSRGERQTLKEALTEAGTDQHSLSVFRRRAFDAARRRVVSPESHLTLSALEEVVKVLCSYGPNQERQEAFFAPQDDCVKRIVGLFRDVSRTADVCVFTITDNRIAEAMLAAHHRGVTIRIVTDNDKGQDLGSDIARLRHAAIGVRVDTSDSNMHHKFAIFDDRIMLTGSYNWTRGAANKNMENLIVTCDPRLVRAFSAEFARLWECFQ